ncbi:MAG: hypothetical protein L0H79_19540 [Intrasporangium sp.]|uniref:hypothetical protein n=1 Tax=Intrasporangium sp. TaxID=1925024 RepID=UPI00264855AE|nr:hypothetical protein [Intrasporangium sp.]MDN5797918.1 hypothetical protein [Intrasporangium sp.]
MSKVKKIILWVVVAFFAYAIYNSPDRAAGIVSDIVSVIVEAFYAILQFFDSLLSRA